jgi:hypothetical protein
MTIVTLEQVQAEHARLAKLIEQLQTPTPKLLVLPEVQIPLQPGERYAGPVLDADGFIRHHLILLPGEAEGVDWEAAQTSAADMGGVLPTRQEQALLYANLKSEFKAVWYWSSEQYESDSSYAWNQFFFIGFQHYYHKSSEGRARAVRRFAA